MKRQLSILILMVMVFIVLTSCSSADVNEKSSEKEQTASMPVATSEESIDIDKLPANNQDGLAPVVKLNSGYEMPVLGIGTWTLKGEEVENAVYWAISDGYRLIDTAYWYENETEVGNGVRRAIDEGICTREELFITSKVPPYGFDDYEQAIEDCNNRLNLGYIDACGIIGLNQESPINTGFERFGPFSLTRKAG